MKFWVDLILRGGSLIDPFLLVVDLEGHYEITISLNNNTINFKIPNETA
jgi:hypothetical protein